MPDLSIQERLQPSLLDRLTDEDPRSTREARDQRFFSLMQLRNAVLRDLSWLLNTVFLEASGDLSAYPRARDSVINYGIPSLTGMLEGELTAESLSRRITECIAAFEPRLLRDSLRVSITDDVGGSGPTLEFTIEADLWAQPVPLRIFMRTEVDREFNTLRVIETPGGRR